MKILKKIGKFSLGIFVLLTLFSFSFKTKEYFVGKKYVEYWKNNPNLYESVGQNELFDFQIFEKAALENDLILFGEFHGAKETVSIDFQFIQYLNEKVGMTIHMAEIDFSQAYFLNKYLREGGDSTVQYVLNSWLIQHGHNNKDYNDKWKKIRELNGVQTDSSLHVKVLGIDRIQDFGITQHHLLDLFKKLELSIDVPGNETEMIEWAKVELPSIIAEIEKETGNEKWIDDILFIQKNLFSFDSQSRGDIMFNNFTYFYNRHNLEGQKIYGYFGGAHVLQREMNHKSDFGNLVVNSNLTLKDRTYSITSRYVDSYMSAPSKYLPPFIRSDNEHTKMSVTCDNMALLYHYGIKDLTEVTEGYTNTYFDIDALNSPYRSSLRLINNIGLYSLLAGMNVSDKNTVTTDYVQAIILIRNSDWAEPKITL